jgi:CheY-like chemotaxis protein
MIKDNPIAQNLLVKQLQRYNLTVIATGNGEEAIHGVHRLFVPSRSLSFILRVGESQTRLLQRRTLRPSFVHILIRNVQCLICL